MAPTPTLPALDIDPSPPLPPRDKWRRVLGILAFSFAGHAAFLAVGAKLTPPPPPAPREVEVVQFASAAAPGDAMVEWRSEGGRQRALIRPDPSVYAR